MESILISSFSALIDTKISDKKNVDKINGYVTKYVDKNSEILYYNSPLYRLYFSDEADRKIIYDIFDVTPKEVKEVTKKIPDVKSSWEVLNNPFNVFMTMLIRESCLKKDLKLMNNSLLYLSLSLYSSLHYKYYRFPPNENIMEYTINNVSNKYLFKQYGSVLKAIIHTIMKNHETYVSDLISHDDTKILKYLMNLRIRLNNLMQNFWKEYRHNHDTKKYLNHETESYDSENYHENDSLSLTITRISEHVSLKFFTSGINLKLLNLAAHMSQTDKNVLKNALESIKENEGEKVKEMISLIIQIYLGDNNSVDSIISKKFAAESISIYSKSNTKDERLLRIKELLDYFLVNNCERYANTERTATKINYRKGLFIYFVMYIQYAQQIK